MLIWGSKGKEKKIREGEFFCPICQRRSRYIHKRLGKYFTLYFIPLFETKKYGEFIECQVCGTPFKPDILEYSNQALEEERKLKNKEEKLISSLRKELESGTPIQLIYSNMLESGVSEENVKIILYTATEGKAKVCHQCEFGYIHTLKFCSNCGERLTEMKRD